MSSADLLSSAGFILVVVGIFTVLIAILLLALSQFHRGEGHVRGGGVIMIGPIPIIFGSDPKTARVMVYLTIILIIVVILLMLLPLLGLR